MNELSTPEVIEARWQDKRDADRRPGFGFWLCGCRECTQVIATARIEYTENRRDYSVEFRGPCLLLSAGVDSKEFDKFRPSTGLRYEKSDRHAARQSNGVYERHGIDSLRCWNQDSLSIEPKARRKDHSETYKRLLQDVKRNANPNAPTVVDADNLPIFVLCPRSGCNRVSVIRAVAVGKGAQKLERLKQRQNEHDKKLGLT